jgi:hypothetical protein
MSAQKTRPEFSIAISAPPIVKVGTPISVKITVTNTSNHVIAFDRWDVGQRDFNIEIVDLQGNPAPSTKYMKATRGEDQGPGPQVVFAGSLVQTDLKPGEALKETADLKELFDLEPGKYTVHLWRRDFQEGHVTSGVTTKPEDMDLSKPPQEGISQPNPPRAAAKPKAVAKSNMITITVTP